MATQINNFKITRLVLGSHLGFHKEVSRIIADFDPSALHLEALVEEYAEAVAKEMTVVVRPTAFAETPQLVAVDRLRDKAVSQLFNLVLVFLKSPLPTEVSAAQRLHAIIASSHGIQAHEYMSKTMEIGVLLTALRAASPDDIRMMALSSAIEQMRTHNDAFNLLIEGRIKGIGVRLPIMNVNTLELRHATDTAYRKIVESVNAYSIVMPSPEIERFAVNINAIIIQYRSVVAHQGMRKKRSTEDDRSND